MFNRGKTIIIPNEDEILQEIFEKDIEFGRSHTQGLQEFSDTFKLGYYFTEDDYQTAPCEIAKDGHLVVKVEDESKLIICYLPERVTDRQLTWMINNIEMLNSYSQVNAFSLHTRFDDGMVWKKLHGVSEIITESKQKNLLPKKGMKNNVR